MSTTVNLTDHVLYKVSCIIQSICLTCRCHSNTSVQTSSRNI